MRAPWTAALALAAALAAAPAAAGAPEIRRLPGGALMSLEDLADLARAHDLVVMGEIHDNPRHQAMQARLAAAAPVSALAFEMTPRAVESALADLRAAQAGGAATEAQREAAEWESYAPYHVVMQAAPEVPVAAGGVARADLRRAMTEGAGAAFAEGDPARWGLDAPLDAQTQAAMEAEIFAAHCDALPEEMLPGMVEAQRLRDAAFGAALLRAHAAAEGEGPAMLVTGNGHTRADRGTPAFLARAAPELSVLAIGQVERREDARTWRDALAPWTEEAAPPPFDVVVVTDPEPREDPCARFLRAREAQEPAGQGG